MSDRRVVIVGGGQAGGRVALSLREGGFQGDITLVAAEPHLPHERPPLSKDLLTGLSQPEGAYLADAAALAGLNITVITATSATAIDPDARQVSLGDGRRLAYDDLVLATGSRPRQLTMNNDAGNGGAGAVPVLRSMADALALRDRLRPGATLAVVGGGVIGLELASSALARGVRPVIIEAADRVMARQIGPAASEFLQGLHRDAGSTLHLGRALRGLQQDGDGFLMTLDDGTEIRADCAVAAIGVIPDTALAEAAGLACDDGILIDARGQTSRPGIWAAGDVARGPVPWSDRPERQESWRNAENQARRVAASILGHDDVAEDPVPGFWSDQLGHRLQAEGSCQGDEIVRPSADGGFAAFHVQDRRLVGCVVLDNPKLAALARRAIGRGVEVDPAALADPAGDPRRILR